jgi:hypothetical protein
MPCRRGLRRRPSQFDHQNERCTGIIAGTTTGWAGHHLLLIVITWVDVHLHVVQHRPDHLQAEDLVPVRDLLKRDEHRHHFLRTAPPPAAISRDPRLSPPHPTPFHPTPFHPTPFHPTPFHPTPVHPTPFHPTPFSPNVCSPSACSPTRDPTPPGAMAMIHCRRGATGCERESGRAAAEPTISYSRSARRLPAGAAHPGAQRGSAAGPPPLQHSSQQGPGARGGGGTAPTTINGGIRVQGSAPPANDTAAHTSVCGVRGTAPKLTRSWAD